MIKLVTKTHAILRSTRGESLMEGIASILVFTVLVASVTMMIMLSLRITHVSTEAANVLQHEANALLGADEPDIVIDTDDDASIVFTVNGSPGDPISVDVSVYSSDTFTAFGPRGGTG